jgi:glycosyltransferase involved in cell wall biosynthesis
MATRFWPAALELKEVNSMATTRSISILGLVHRGTSNAYGGAPVVVLNLANHFVKRGIRVHVPVFTRERPDQLPFPFEPEVDVTALDGQSRLALFAQVVAHLREHRPQVVMAGGNKADVLAARASRVPGLTLDLWASLHHHLSSEMGGWPEAKRRRRIRTWRSIIRRAKGVITVSQGLADDLVQVTGCPVDKVQVIHNPIIHSGLGPRLQEPADHPWLADGGPPVILGVGRLTAQKDFATLIGAFALVHKRRPSRLLIIGEGEERDSLASLAALLGLSDAVDLAGFKPNPLPFMRGARLVAMSSRWEGFGNVLVEALYCGTPVVSTDCPHGPREVLEDGRYGRLVAVGDHGALAAAMLDTLDQEPDRERLRLRAADFSVERSGDRYLEIMGLLGSKGRST